jgi:hypothetical protein
MGAGHENAGSNSQSLSGQAKESAHKAWHSVPSSKGDKRSALLVSIFNLLKPLDKYWTR